MSAYKKRRKKEERDREREGLYNIMYPTKEHLKELFRKWQKQEENFILQFIYIGIARRWLTFVPQNGRNLFPKRRTKSSTKLLKKKKVQTYSIT